MWLAFSLWFWLTPSRSLYFESFWKGVGWTVNTGGSVKTELPSLVLIHFYHYNFCLFKHCLMHCSFKPEEWFVRKVWQILKSLAFRLRAICKVSSCHLAKFDPTSLFWLTTYLLFFPIRHGHSWKSIGFANWILLVNIVRKLALTLHKN